MCSSFYRTGYELREKTYKRGEGNKIFCGLNLPSIYVDSITKKLERIKAYANWKYNTHRVKRHLAAKNRKRRFYVFQEEVVILEESKYAEIQDKTTKEE